jgi:acetate kinase
MIEDLAELAPLHNRDSAAIIKACMEIFKGVPEIAVFDSEFHKTMPDYACIYGLPYKYYEKYGIKKHGFHGISHQYVSQKCSELMGKDIKELKIVSCHLGGGCSVAAIDGGRSIDTSMGFTPVDGLLMATRCGEIDSSAVLFLMKKENLSVDQMIEVLNKESGYLGVTGISGNSQPVVEAATKGDARAELLLKMQSYRVKKYIGAYAAAMNGLDAVIFTGGIGENSTRTRELICSGMEFFSLELSKELNLSEASDCRRISTTDSKDIWVIPVNEEWLIAQKVKEVLIKEKYIDQLEL